MYKKILVPLDGSELAEKILPQIEDLAKCLQAEIVLFTAGNITSFSFITEMRQDIIKHISDAQLNASAKTLARIADNLKEKGLEASYMYREGNPANEIIKAANETNCDLIAMATHGRGEITWVLGSVAEKVVSHATIPVLIVHVIEMLPPVKK